MRYSWLPMSLLVAAFLAFVGTAVGASLSLADLLERDAERSEALRTQTELQRLMTLLVDVETGQRGFLITGQQAFLRPYEEAVGELGEVRRSVHQRIPRRSANRLMLTRLDALIDERLRQARTAVDRRLVQGAAWTSCASRSTNWPTSSRRRWRRPMRPRRPSGSAPRSSRGCCLPSAS